MENIYFLLGGARSGKSSYAEELASSLSSRVAYVATAKITDMEMEKRVKAHRRRRPEGWKTFELGKKDIENIGGVLNKIEEGKYGAVLLDCVTNLLFRILEKFDIEGKEVLGNREEKVIEDYALGFFKELLDSIREKNFKTVIVSNEVGTGIVPAFPLGRLFRDIMGVVNKEIASQAGHVYYFIAGIKQKLK